MKRVHNQRGPVQGSHTKQGRGKLPAPRKYIRKSITTPEADLTWANWGGLWGLFARLFRGSR